MGQRRWFSKWKTYMCHLWKRNYGKCLASTSGCYGCGKDDHKVTDFPIIVDRGREGKQVSPNVPKDNGQNKRRSYALRTNGSKPDEQDNYSKSLYLFSVMSSFYVGEYIE